MYIKYHTLLFFCKKSLTNIEKFAAKPLKCITFGGNAYDICGTCKNKLSSLIHEMATAPWLFSKNPEVDFSRNRKLDFVSTIQFLLSMESGSLKKELLDYFQFSVDTPSASAFCQQRNKLLLEAFQFLFYEFNSCFSFEKKYKDYQLLACDGSDLNIARNPNDAGTYFQSQPTDRGFNQIHLNALFDLCEKRCTSVSSPSLYV